MDEQPLEKEQIDLLAQLVEIYQSLPREKRRDFLYQQALTRTSGTRPIAEIQKAFETSIVMHGDQIWRSMADVPKNYDRDFVVHPETPNASIAVLQHDIDALLYHDLIRLRGKDHLFITPKGLKPSTEYQNENATEDTTSQNLSKIVTQLCNDVGSYAGSNFTVAPNPEWLRLREQLSILSNFITTYGYLFDPAVSIAVRAIHGFCMETISGINRGNSARNTHNNEISVEGITIRSGYWMGFTRQISGLRDHLTEALRANARRDELQFHQQPLIEEKQAEDTFAPGEVTSKDQETDYLVEVAIESPGPSRGRLTVDGEEIAEEQGLTIFGVPPDKIIVSIYDQGALNRLADFRFSDFSSPISAIEFYKVEPSHPGFALSAYMYPETDHKLRFEFNFFTEDWKQTWSITEFKNAFGVALSSKTNATLTGEDPFSFEVNCYEVHPRIGDIIAEAMLVAGSLVLEAESALETEARGNVLVTYFGFPTEVAVACEQYLVYFVQFLKSLGVEAEADLSHQAGQLLFSVKPDAQDVALEKIREALNIYLQLPANPNIGHEMILVGDVQIQQLISNVQHLQGQLRLASATIQQQSMTINQAQAFVISQASLIETQQKILSGEVVLSSLKTAPVSAAKEDKEKLLGGIITLGVAEKFGVGLDLAEALRKGRSLFSKASVELTRSDNEDDSAEHLKD